MKQIKYLISNNRKNTFLQQFFRRNNDNLEDQSFSYNLFLYFKYISSHTHMKFDKTTNNKKLLKLRSKQTQKIFQYKKFFQHIKAFKRFKPSNQMISNSQFRSKTLNISKNLTNKISNSNSSISPIFQHFSLNYSQILNQFRYFQAAPDQFITYLSNKFASLIPISIDKLLINDKERIWQNLNFNFIDTLNYLKQIRRSIQNMQKMKNIVLIKGYHTLLLRQRLHRPSINNMFLGKFVSIIGRQVLENRKDFLEKIQQNQMKYQNSQTKLSQVSQELLFLAKIYRDNNQQLKKLLISLKQKIIRNEAKYSNLFQKETKSSLNQQKDSLNQQKDSCQYLQMKQKFNNEKNIDQKMIEQNSLQLQYHIILMKKNIIQAFNEKPINQFTYFEQKDEQIKIKIFYELSQQQFKVQIQYNDEKYLKQCQRFVQIKRRNKNKKQKFTPLVTACSCCFSDIYEQSNPMLTCGGCLLNCHKLCYNLESQKCDSCSYIKLSKSKKQTIDQCLICKQTGQMLHKFVEGIYVHYFCMLFHGFWKVNRIQVNKSLKQESIVLEKCQENLANSKKVQYSLELDTSKINKIIPINLSENQLSSSFAWEKELQTKSSMIDQVLSILQYSPSPRFQLLQYEQSMQLLFVDANNSKQWQDYNTIRQNFQQRLFAEENISKVCKLCNKSILDDLYISFRESDQKYHGFCAYFQGYSFEKLQRISLDQKVYVQLKNGSLISERQKLKRKRYFILNKDNFLFDK